jgi:alkylation response protein AidB-like acyl-CoA dehydrogenase
MEFDWPAEHRAFRKDVRAFVRSALPANWWTELSIHGKGAREQIAFSRDFCARMAKAGLLIQHWPQEFGGAGADPWRQFILAEELSAASEPRGPQYMNVNWIGPALMKYGSDRQKEEHLARIAAGAVIWCQGFSEPQAGTDLAALQLKAERRGEGYVLNGMKTWTSYAYMADWCFLLARSGPQRKAISVFLVPMDLPGIEVRAIPSLDEDGHIHEMHFNDVVVGSDALLGEESKGWEVITFALTRERVGSPRYEVGLRILTSAVAQLKANGRYEDPIVRAAAGRIAAQLEAARVLTYLVVDQRSQGDAPSADPNIQRVTATHAIRDLRDFIAEYLPEVLLDGDAQLRVFYRENISASIAAGTYELQLNLIAQRGLDLPRGAPR